MKTITKPIHVENLEVFGVTVQREVETGFLSLTSLQNIYNDLAVKNGWRAKKISSILQRRPTCESIYHILKEQRVTNMEHAEFNEEIDEAGIIRLLKRHNVYKTVGASAERIVWTSQDIWMLIAGLLHPMLFAYQSRILYKLDKFGESKNPTADKDDQEDVAF